MNVLAQDADVEDFLSGEMKRLSASGNLTKRTAVRLAIANAITSGILKKGTLIPTEKRLTQVMGISLGTVQAALQQLQQSSVIIRRRGHGSRVASNEAFGREAWHFRLLQKENGQPLRISKVDVEIESTHSVGSWSKFFGGSEKFIRVRRRMIMGDNINIGAEMLLPSTLVPGMAKITPDELKMISIRRFLTERYDILVSRADHQIDVIHIDDFDAKRYDLLLGMEAFEIIANAYLSDGQPGYWLRIVAPCRKCRVTL